MSRYSLRKLIESADAFELIEKHRPVDELAEWAKSNVKGGFMSARVISEELTVTINGVPLKSIEARARSSIEQWLGNGWWRQVNWDAYNASGDGRDFYDLEKYPKQTGPNTFSILAPKNAADWDIPTNPDGTYEIKLESYTKTKDDDLANEMHDQLMKWTEPSRGRKQTVEDLNRKFMSKYGMFLSTPRIRQEIEDWNSHWPGWPINLQESKRGNKMKLTKRQLKRIIREEYSRLKRRGLIREFGADQLADEENDVGTWIHSQASRPEGVSLDEIVDQWGETALDLVDQMGIFDGTGELWFDDQEAVVYAAGSQPSSGLGSAVDRYTRR